FAGNHGGTAQGVSAYPAEVTAQMVANFSAGGAAINQLARTVGANLHVIPLALEQPTADFTQALAMNEDAFLTAVGTGYEAVSAGADLVCLGEMGIGNTTAAAAIAAALFGGGGARWAGRGTGLDDDGLARKRSVIDAALARHAGVLGDPLLIAAALGGRELAAILGVTRGVRLCALRPGDGVKKSSRHMAAPAARGSERAALGVCKVGQRLVVSCKSLRRIMELVAPNDRAGRSDGAADQKPRLAVAE